MNSFITLLRRELWEHTSLKAIPVMLLVFVLLANLAFIFFIATANGTMTISTAGDCRKERARKAV